MWIGYPSFVDHIPSAGRSDAVAVGGVADHLRLPSERGTWPSKLAAMIMRRVGRVSILVTALCRVMLLP